MEVSSSSPAVAEDAKARATASDGPERGGGAARAATRRRRQGLAMVLSGATVETIVRRWLVHGRWWPRHFLPW
ncbi:hypothetical protein E2562_007080 [Oryza meyeriana var. granulata]|uniref:Uncharacterized protein n=1 Tax=Oryza meyeriana var. granulata TaxID=110450 RepID=A0A6G1F4P6_9ORYZ|nr:hypothetical protein E2562_007080 [Oryza meyeriana var. granulata]